MLNNVRSIASCFVALSFAVVACGDGDSDEGGAGGGAGKGGSAGTTGGSSGASGKGGSAGSSAGKGGSAGTAGSTGGTAGSTAGTAGTAGAAGSGEGGSGGSGEGGMAGNGEAGTGDGGTPGDSGGEGGVGAIGGAGGDDGSGGAPEGGVGGEPSAGGAGNAGEGGVPSVAGAGGEGGAPVVEFDTLENGGFETGAFDVPPVGWTIVGTEGVVTKKWGSGGEVHDGESYLNLWLGSEYTVDISQVISPIPNGTYTLRAWHYGGPYTEQYVYVSGYDQANPSATDEVDTVENAALAELVIPNIVVTSGQITVGIHSVGAAGNWSHFDGISLTLDSP